MIPGETILNSGARRCDTCGTPLALGVHRSAAGFYIGTACACGPYSRESRGYHPTAEAAAADLARPSAHWCRT